MAVITNWLTIMKYPYLNWQWIFSLICRFFPSSINDNSFVKLYGQGGCLFKKQELLTLREHLGSPQFLGVGSMLLIFLGSFYFADHLCIHQRCACGKDFDFHEFLPKI